jgi:hypothetical protein
VGLTFIVMNAKSQVGVKFHASTKRTNTKSNTTCTKAIDKYICFKVKKDKQKSTLRVQQNFGSKYNALHRELLVNSSRISAHIAQ